MALEKLTYSFKEYFLKSHLTQVRLTRLTDHQSSLTGYTAQVYSFIPELSKRYVTKRIIHVFSVAARVMQKDVFSTRL